MTRRTQGLTPWQLFWWTFGLVFMFLTLFCSPAQGQEAHWERVVPPILHQGNWQSCKDSDGLWGERVLEHVQLGVYQWELHMGPEDEFALYAQKVDGPDHVHSEQDNLLGPAYRVGDVSTWRGKRNWSVSKLHLWLSITEAGGSRSDCRSFYIRIERKR